jgi:hypothetical protein
MARLFQFEFLGARHGRDRSGGPVGRTIKVCCKVCLPESFGCDRMIKGAGAEKFQIAGGIGRSMRSPNGSRDRGFLPQVLVDNPARLHGFAD